MTKTEKLACAIEGLIEAKICQALYNAHPERDPEMLGYNSVTRAVEEAQKILLKALSPAREPKAKAPEYPTRPKAASGKGSPELAAALKVLRQHGQPKPPRPR